jgi:hypothetical protein
VSPSDESERRVAEALRARATGAGRPGPVAGEPGGMSVRSALLTALLAGAVLGLLLALLSLLLPGLLPPLG